MIQRRSVTSRDGRSNGLDDRSNLSYVGAMESTAQDTRSQIIASGRKLIAARGYCGVGLTELLREAGVPKGSFYHYFASKEAYGCAVLEAFTEDYADLLRRTLNHPKWTARTRFMAYFAECYGRQTSDNPEDRCLVVRLSAEVADLSPAMSDVLRKGVRIIEDRLIRTLDDGLQDGSIGAIDDTGELGRALYRQWLGASLLAALSHDDMPLKSTMDFIEAQLPLP